ncbi:hypothetical protein QBL02_13185 [Leucobacter sp. UT-8R-CII-1-4]|uniref:hypothetical protein n=1 Tax=Leucobacter sp. UT-8R-CII-1-4 TaxID=3040075 RepID=UPI0024A874F8|nr:hypothetical protein [Leucobacter sp. UT-8R-CII-1-4]MDI6024495.1 hypothetical protein [Leucobacter sp. UT-8R-CII-1-4]
MTDIEKMMHGAASSQATLIEQSRSVAEVAAAIQVALQFPRDLEGIKAEVRELCGSLAVAEQAFYEVPNRGGGVSIHLARELARVWGNTDYGVRELSRESGKSEMQAWCWDQQKNTRNTRSFIQPHKKSVRGGGWADTEDLGDIYLSNQNTGSRALRECILATLPGWLKSEAVAMCRQTLRHGEGEPLDQRIENALSRFSEMNVTEKQLEQRLEKPRSKWEATDVGRMSRIWATITQDGIPATEFFPQKPVEIDG